MHCHIHHNAAPRTCSMCAAAMNELLAQRLVIGDRPPTPAKIAEAAVVNKADDDVEIPDLAWIKRRERNDLAKAAMVAIIQKRPNETTDCDVIFDRVARGAYAYADAMLAASGDYDE